MQGADPATVREAIATRDPLPGTHGFAGAIDTGLIRDILGRYPLFSELNDPTTWSPDPTALSHPIAVPAGHRRDTSGDTAIWTLPTPSTYTDETRAISAIHDAVTTSLDDVDDAPAIAFSGGLDSAVLAAHLPGPLYVGGFPESHDLAAARSAADILDRDLTVVEFTHADIEAAIPPIVRATGRSNAMDIQIALPLYLVASRVASDGYDTLAVGQGADELFGGYAKIANAPTDPRVDAQTVRGATTEVIRSLPSQLERDVLTLRAAGVDVIAPFLHDRVVTTALRLPGRLLVADEDRKHALRQAMDFLPPTLRERDKKAIQYGSYAARELDRMARQAGFKRRMDNHIEQYIESLTA